MAAVAPANKNARIICALRCSREATPSAPEIVDAITVGLQLPELTAEALVERMELPCMFVAGELASGIGSAAALQTQMRQHPLSLRAGRRSLPLAVFSYRR